MVDWFCIHSRNIFFKKGICKTAALSFNSMCWSSRNAQICKLQNPCSLAVSNIARSQGKTYVCLVDCFTVCATSWLWNYLGCKTNSFGESSQNLNLVEQNSRKHISTYILQNISNFIKARMCLSKWMSPTWNKTMTREITQSLLITRLQLVY